MKIFQLIGAVWLFSLVALAPLGGDAAEKMRSEKEKINALIASLESLKGAAFIRNGTTYDSKTAAKFLRGKWQANEKTIQTAADFIERVATSSSTSGQPYLIRLQGGSKIKCADHLKAELTKLNAPSKIPPPSKTPE